MKVYGITGGAGTGKSEVIKMLQENFGGCVIMSDEVARELMQKGNISYQLIVEYFGRDILMDDGEIDRKKLADHVFNNKEALEKLNSMTHPYVKDEIRKLIAVMDGIANLPPLIGKTARKSSFGETSVKDLQPRDGCARTAGRSFFRIPFRKSGIYQNACDLGGR